MTEAVPLVAFWILVGLTFADRQRRARLRQKEGGDWALDLAGLVIQGALVPLLEVTLVFGLLAALFPAARGAWELPFWAAFALNFVVIDYLYYWNHRLLHARWLWPAHRVHHSMTELDVLGTSRNTLWSSALIVYLWANGAVLFLLADPAPFALAAALTAALDLWRHSPVGPARGTRAWRWLSSVFILPADHAWHHSARQPFGNYGANLSLWDRLHGTWIVEERAPERLGIDPGLSLGRKLLWPFGPEREPEEAT